MMVHGLETMKKLNDEAAAREREWVTWERVTHSETDIWFWWNGEHSFPVNIMRDSDGRFFACVGQWGWTRAQFLEEMGGLWLPCLCPEPNEKAKKGR